MIKRYPRGRHSVALLFFLSQCVSHTEIPGLSNIILVKKNMKAIFPLYPEARVPDEQKLVTVADLDAFGEKILSTIRLMIQGNGNLTSKKWLKSHQVRKLINISAGTLQTLRSNGTIPYTRIGGIIYYDSAEIEKMMINHKHSVSSLE